MNQNLFMSSQSQQQRGLSSNAKNNNENSLNNKKMANNMNNNHNNLKGQTRKSIDESKKMSDSNSIMWSLYNNTLGSNSGSQQNDHTESLFGMDNSSSPFFSLSGESPQQQVTSPQQNNDHQTTQIQLISQLQSQRNQHQQQHNNLIKNSSKNQTPSLNYSSQNSPTNNASNDYGNNRNSPLSASLSPNQQQQQQQQQQPQQQQHQQHQNQQSNNYQNHTQQLSNLLLQHQRQSNQQKLQQLKQQQQQQIEKNERDHQLMSKSQSVQHSQYQSQSHQKPQLNKRSNMQINLSQMNQSYNDIYNTPINRNIYKPVRGPSVNSNNDTHNHSSNILNGNNGHGSSSSSAVGTKNGNTPEYPAATNVNHIISPQPLISPSINDTVAHHSFFSPPVAPHEAELMIIRQKYKAKSSIPQDVSIANYAQQCIYAAISSRLPPFSLHIDEYNLLRSYIPQVHVTTYLNIRNGILRLWLSNPKVNVTRSEAAGCVKDDRFFNLAEVAYDWLVRGGYINFGCFEYPSLDFYNPIPEDSRKPRKTIVIIGAGIAGLSCARQLDNLFQRKARHFAEYQGTPRVVVLEGKRRIGGRIYSAHLKSDRSHAVDMGAQFIPGFGNGNPLAVVCRRQLGLPVTKVSPRTEIYDSLKKAKVSPELERRSTLLFNHLLERIGQFKSTISPPATADGEEVLLRLCKDPPVEEYPGNLTLAKAEDIDRRKDKRHRKFDNDKQHEDYSYKENLGKIEAQFLKEIGITLKPGVADDAVIHLIPEPQGDMYPSLGISMDAFLRQLQDISNITPEELRILNWHYANLEYQHGACLDHLSLNNWKHEGQNFTGQHSIVKNGFMNLARGLYLFPENLDVRFKANVKFVEYSKDKVELYMENGERIKADKAVVTVPLGVLKDRTIQFIPDLPQWKQDSIERLGFGVINKVCIINFFSPKNLVHYF